MEEEEEEKEEEEKARPPAATTDNESRKLRESRVHDVPPLGGRRIDVVRWHRSGRVLGVSEA